MAFFTALTLTGGALAARAAARHKPTRIRLVDVLIDGEPKQATLLPPKSQQSFTRVRQVTQEIFSDTRQQQQQELNTTYAATEEQATEALRRQDMIVAGSSLGFALLAPVVTPLLFLPSIACSLAVIWSPSMSTNSPWSATVSPVFRPGPSNTWSGTWSARASRSQITWADC